MNSQWEPLPHDVAEWMGMEVVPYAGATSTGPPFDPGAEAETGTRLGRAVEADSIAS